MKYLLIYIREWAEKFPTYNAVWSLNTIKDGAASDRDNFASTSETEWYGVYNALLKEHVAFPSREQRSKAASARVHTTNNKPTYNGTIEEEAKTSTDRMYSASEARDLIQEYHTLREQISIAEKSILPCQTNEKMQHVATLKKFLIFSERYLEKLVRTKVAVKKKNEKVVKIMNYN